MGRKLEEELSGPGVYELIKISIIANRFKFQIKEELRFDLKG